ncbi:MAG: hypothetical protein OHK0056_32200 [Bacteriovoracaceae bacterium]
MFFRFLSIMLLLISSLRAEVLKLDITSREEEYISFKEACEFMGHKHNLLVDYPDLLNLNCMGKNVSIKDFCLKKYSGERKFLRGYVQPKLKEVVCEFGQQVVLSVACDKRDKKYCEKPILGCEKLREIYAYSLNLYHHSFLEKDVDDVLNCYFGDAQNSLPKSKWP